MLNEAQRNAQSAVYQLIAEQGRNTVCHFIAEHVWKSRHTILPPSNPAQTFIKFDEIYQGIVPIIKDLIGQRAIPALTTELSPEATLIADQLHDLAVIRGNSEADLKSQAQERARNRKKDISGDDSLALLLAHADGIFQGSVYLSAPTPRNTSAERR